MPLRLRQTDDLKALFNANTLRSLSKRNALLQYQNTTNNFAFRDQIVESEIFHQSVTDGTVSSTFLERLAPKLDLSDMSYRNMDGGAF
jgi:hypothetical protein